MKIQDNHNPFITHVHSVVHKLSVLWKEWNVQTLVIASLTFQLILILVGSFRKQTTNRLVIVSVWLSYLLADWVAAQAVGLISNSADTLTREGELFAFWAQFLLLHLGGPDTVTALALEDNNLWLRTGLHLGVQAYATSGILVKSVLYSSLWAPTILMYFAGIIKYLERVLALLHGRLTNFDEDPYHYAETLERYEPRVAFVGPHKELTDIEMVRDAFYFFHYYRGLYADRIVNYPRRIRSKRYFNRIQKPEDAFKVLEIQFNFAYEALYTKMVVIRSTFWRFLRPVVMLFEVACFVIWYFSKKHGFGGFEIRVTYALLIGAIAVDVLAIFRLQLSYWNIAHLRKESRIRTWFYSKLLSTRNRTWGKYWRKEDAPIRPWFRRAFFRRWSESVLQMNLVKMSIHERSKKIQKVEQFFGVKDKVDAIIHLRKKWFSNHLRDFIFHDLKDKSGWAKTHDVIPRYASYICYAKGSWVCQQIKDDLEEGLDISKVHALLDASGEYEIILLRWHVITELWYKLDDDKIQISSDAEEEVLGVAEYRMICKTLSDYMIYLLIRQPVMMSSVVSGTSQIFQEARDIIKEAYKQSGRSLAKIGSVEGVGRRPPQQNDPRREEKAGDGDIEMATNEGEKGADKVDVEVQMLKVYTSVFPFPIDTIMEELGALEEKWNVKWKFMAEVWAELVYYAAIRCKPSAHAAQLKQGGELLSYVWLLMVQFGFGLFLSEHEAVQFQQDLRQAEQQNVSA